MTFPLAGQKFHLRLSTSPGWIGKIFCTDIHGSWRMNLSDFDCFLRSTTVRLTFVVFSEMDCWYTHSRSPRMNRSIFGDPLTFHLVASWHRSFCVSITLVYDHVMATPLVTLLRSWRCAVACSFSFKSSLWLVYDPLVPAIFTLMMVCFVDAFLMCDHGHCLLRV